MQSQSTSFPAVTDRELNAAVEHALWRLCDIYRDDPEALRGLIEEYQQESQKLINQLRLAVRGGELAAVKASAQALKADAVLFGELALSRACAALEQAPPSVSRRRLETLFGKVVYEQARSQTILTMKYRAFVGSLIKEHLC